ncbi:hypothetical protein XELAEV_18041999mg [Xenopus laevis]|uniref:Uncharacterized protein n=1 Tax=Xenopus laevis TaxID=8355 RepID=A0A974C3E5_XENLA|nr:hypothetical protein XELAEV_18041999mg [Xenopus laevis]
MFDDDEEFVDRWESILNKCSLDLELALMERIQKELPTSSQKKTAVEQKVRNLETPERFEAGRSKMQDALRHFQDETEMRKRQKFQRDGADYESGNVYRWPQSEYSSFRKGAYGRRSRNNHKREWRQTGGTASDSDSSVASADFLGGSQTTAPINGEGGAVGNTEGRRQNRPQRTRMRRTRWW